MAKRTCSVEGCERPAWARGWCGKHYQRWRNFGDLEPERTRRWPTRGTVCGVDGCSDPHSAHGYCAKHAARWKRWGDPLGSARPRTPDDWFWPKVNKAGPIPDLCPELGPCWLWMGQTIRGYGVTDRREKGRSRLAHRVAYELVVGPIPSGLDLDHLCNNRSCVCPTHLEPVTQAENNRRAGQRKTHCIKGHDWSDPRNVIVRKNGIRWCAECNRQWCRARYQRLKMAK